MSRGAHISKLLLTLLIAMVGVGALARIGYELYLAERPIPEAGDAGPVKVVSPIASKIVLIIVDSLREEAARDAKTMPYLNKLAAEGASGVAITPHMTLTTMSVVDMATGMTPPISWSLKNFDAEPFEDENIFSLMKAAGHKIALVGDASWTQLFGQHADKIFSVPERGWYQGGEEPLTEVDTSILAEARKALSDPSFSMVVIHVVGSDKAAHKFGAHLRDADQKPGMYAQTLTALDWEFRQLHEAFGRDRIWWVQSDHGCNLRGNHGGGEVEARRAPFVVTGPGIVPQQGVEHSLNAVAPTLMALMGLRPPRCAEVSATFRLLEHRPEDELLLAESHLVARHSFVRSFFDHYGREAPSREIQPTTREALHQQLAEFNRSIVTAGRDKDWLRSVGVLIGLSMMLFLMLLLAQASALENPWRISVIFTAFLWILLVINGWQFKLIQVFGELLQSPMGFVLRLGVVALVVGLLVAVAVAVRRFGVLSSTGVAWLGWGLVVLALGQSVMRWPYGPLPETYRAMMILTLMAGLCTLLYRRHYEWPKIAASLAAMVGLYLLSNGLFGDEVRASDSFYSTLVSDIAVLLTVGALAFHALKSSQTNSRQTMVWMLLFILTIGALVYHRAQYVWMIKPLLCATLLPVILSYFSDVDARFTRNMSLALALVIYRALGLDYRLLILLMLVLAILPLSALRSNRKRYWLPIAAALATLAHYSYFYEVGHAYSFSAIDVSVAFAATRDAVNLGESFVFLIVQHLAPLLVLVAGLNHFSAINGDNRAVLVCSVAFMGAFVVQAWGAFASFEYELHNHWFTMHAVPVMLFSLCTVCLSGLAAWISSPAGEVIQSEGDDGFG
ncbi:MAG TPA: hypothetical protein EYN06_07295 [Myxococcales bacterium]|nr:hypothetical protein [Myxococcales bacterium]HIN86269.1 hypothetical protein [Myxococcales bacterium]